MSFQCALCGYSSDERTEFVEFLDPVKLPKIIERARSRGRSVRAEEVKYICLKCSVELYQEETKPPKIS
jgi:hypothetical protein